MKLTDRINSMPALEAVRGAALALDRLQSETPEVQVMGTAVLLRTMCLGAGLDISEVLNKAERMQHDGDLTRAASALYDYAKEEVR